MNDKKMQGYRLVVEPSGKKRNRSRSRSHSRRKNRFHGKRKYLIYIAIHHILHHTLHLQEAQVLALLLILQNHHLPWVIHIATIRKNSKQLKIKNHWSNSKVKNSDLYIFGQDTFLGVTYSRFINSILLQDIFKK